MAWRERPKIGQQRQPRLRRTEGVWHPCGACAVRYCGKVAEVCRKSLQLMVAGEPIADCGDRVAPYWQRED